MNTKITLLIGLFTGLLIGSPILADDTEIYVGANPSSGRSNVLLQLDTSGSMNAHVINFDAVDSTVLDPNDSASIVNIHPKYNPNIDYDALGDNPGTPGCYDNNYYTSKNRYDGPVVPYVVQFTNNNPQGTLLDYVCDRDARASNTRADLYNPGSDDRDGTARSGTIANLACPEARIALTTKGIYFDSDFVCDDAYSDVNYSSTNNDNEKVPVAIYSGNFLDFVESITDNNGFPIQVNTLPIAVTAANGSIVAPGMPLLDASGSTIRADWEDFFVESRLQIVKDVVNDIIKNDSDFNINVGLSRFTNVRSTDGGLIDRDLINIGRSDSDSTTAQVLQNRQSLTAQLNNFVAYSGTPLEETYYEGYLYFSGLNERYGQNGDPAAFINGSGSQYDTPIEYACQKNSIILLTDGKPTGDVDANSRIRNLYNAAYDPDTNCNGNGECMNELSKYMWEQDLLPSDVGLIGPDGSVLTTDLGIQQKVQTHTIGFLNNNPLLADTANASEGLFSFASNSADLKSVFADALSQIIDESSSFTAPSLSVNNFDRLTNNEEVYYTLFKPERTPVWLGNIKKYKIKNGVIVDQNDNPAIDSSTGAFRDSASSFWTPSGVLDGNEIENGGFASRLTSVRSVFSDLTTDTNLSSNANVVSNSTITTDLLGLTSGEIALKDNLVQWMIGQNPDGSTIQSIGDTLHTTPVILTYGATKTTDINGNLQTEFDQAIYFGTNSGFLHAIDPTPAATGSMEEFAYIPSDLLPQVRNFATNKNSGAFSKLYGIDGPISSWLENDNGDEIIDATNGEKAHIYVTLRRGGKSVYALDVTDRAAPNLEWKINSSTPGFEELGQTWSEVQHAVIPYGNGTKDVLIFAGGYDPLNDYALVRTPDTQGRAIYMVDASNGSLLWRAVPESSGSAPIGANQFQSANLKYSIPSDISVLDVNADGITDRMYVGDMGGQLWRFDIMSSSSGSFSVSGDVIADLSSDSSTTNNRKFYYPPSVSRVSDDVFGSYISIAIGSGKRANPVNTDTNDKFYMIKDPYAFDPKYTAANPTTPNYDYLSDNGSFGKIVDNGTAIVDITNNLNPTYDEIGDFGWSLDFSGSGEKVLSKALTADNKIFFTTYSPGSNAIGQSCDPAASLGSGKLYSVSLLTGSTAFNKNDSNLTDLSNTDVDLDNSVADDRFVDLSSPGIPPSPSLIFAPTEVSTSTGSTDPLIDPLTGLPISVDPDTGYAVTIDPITGESTPVISQVTGDVVTIDPITGEPDPVIDPDTGELVDPITGEVVETNNCATNRAATLVVSKETFLPPICTAPVRTYWHRYVQ